MPPVARTPNLLWHTLITLRGNPRACVWTEPLWGLSMALVLPYMRCCAAMLETELSLDA